MKINTLKFKELLKEKKIRQAELARELEIKPQSLNTFFNRGEIPQKYKDRLYELFGESLREAVTSKETFYLMSKGDVLMENSGKYVDEKIKMLNNEIRLLKSQLHALSDLVESKQKIIELLESRQKE